VNTSGHDFVVVEDQIRFGLDAVKNVGYAAVGKVLEARQKDGPFTSIWDFCARVDSRSVNKKAIESLIKCGAFDSTGASRRGMLEVLAQAQGAGLKAQEDRLSGQASIFDLGDGGNGGQASTPAHAPVPLGEYERTDLLRMEKETLGIFLSSHPLADVRDLLRARVDCPLAALAEKPDGAWVRVGGLITEAKRIRTKSGEPMMFATLDDIDGQVELIIFNSAYAAAEAGVSVDSRVLVRGRVDHKDRGDTKLVVQEIEPFDPTAEEIQTAKVKRIAPALEPLLLRVDARRCADSLIGDLKSVLEHFPGQTDVMLYMETSTGPRRLRFGPACRVTPSGALRAELHDLLGPDALSPLQEAG
jgi:DNA polymerase-3 subunit alpha